MTVIRRCLFKDEDEPLPSILRYERSLSITVYRTSFTIYSCMGSRHHEPHLIRIEFGNFVKNANSTRPRLVVKQTNPIPKENRDRIFHRAKILQCPIGKCDMKFQKTLTEDLEDSTADIYKCKGSTKANHFGHYMKICHGRLEGGHDPMGGPIGILCITIEK